MFIFYAFRVFWWVETMRNYNKPLLKLVESTENYMRFREMLALIRNVLLKCRACDWPTG